MMAQLWVGRFGYGDLKKVALSGAAGLWDLDRLELLVAANRSGVLCSESLLAWEWSTTVSFSPSTRPCCEALRATVRIA